MPRTREGMRVGPTPKTGEDKRPWTVIKEDGTTQNVWYEETAKEMVAMGLGKSYKKRGRYSRLKLAARPAAARKMTRKPKPVKA